MVEEARSRCISVLEATRQKRRKRGVKRAPMDPDTIRKRHGAVLGLSSMVISSPYTVPSWMPKVLVELSSCVNDPPPISTDVRKLFADFMRTHRDEWQLHKQAFTADELEIVSELTISPSYYA
ncbi:Proteasome activator complex subunit 4 [Gracilaria domingensis]|nr:Proteasome activator complex subunit 4 [Gracilaria domingensis]